MAPKRQEDMMDRGSCYTQGMTPKEHITAILKASTTGIQAAGYVKYTNRVFKGLSESIYTEAVKSWIFEILQNIRDCQIEFSSQLPACLLRISLLEHDPFNIGEGCIVISWNEPGFSHRNVEGLCTVGGSTKTDRSDLIGHKGIGFKAVFSVAKKATILSKPKGYYFRLTGDDRRDENLQYIVPEWVSPSSVPSEIWNASDLTLALDHYNEYLCHDRPIQPTEGFIDQPTVLCLSLQSDKIEICKSLITTDEKISAESIIFLTKPDVITTQFIPHRNKTHPMRIISRSIQSSQNQSQFLRIRTSWVGELEMSSTESPSSKKSRKPTERKKRRAEGEIEKEMVMRSINVSEYFLLDYQPAELLPISVAIDVSRFYADVGDTSALSVAHPRKKTKWDVASSRFTVSAGVGSSIVDAEKENSEISTGVRPYLYSGLPVQTLRHSLPWAVQGPFALTSNREALQDIDANKVYLSHVPSALISAFRALSAVSELRLAAIYSVPSSKQLEAMKYNALVNRSLTTLSGRLQEEPLVPVGFGDKVEWRVGSQTTRLSVSFYENLIKLIANSRPQDLQNLSAIFISNNIITPDIVIPPNAVDSSIIETLGVPISSPIPRSSRATKTSVPSELKSSDRLVDKLLDVLSSPAVQWALQFKLVSDDMSENQISRSALQSAWSNLMCHLMWITVKPSSDDGTDRFDQKICAKIKRQLFIPTDPIDPRISSKEKTADCSTEQKPSKFRSLDSFIYLSSKFGGQSRLEDLKVPKSEKGESSREVRSRVNEKRGASTNDTTDSGGVGSSVDEEMRSYSSSESCEFLRPKRIKNKKTGVRTSRNVPSTTKPPTVKLSCFERGVDEAFLESLKMLGPELHPQLLSCSIQPPSTHRDHDRLIDWLKLGLRLEPFSIASFVRDLSQHARSQVIAKLESSQSVFRDDPQLLAPLSTILRFILVNAKSDAVLDSFVPCLFNFPRISENGHLIESSPCVMVPRLICHSKKKCSAGLLSLCQSLPGDEKSGRQLSWPAPFLHDFYMICGKEDASVQFAKDYFRRWNSKVEDDEYFMRVSRALRLINVCDDMSSPNGEVELKQHRQLLEVTSIVKLNQIQGMQGQTALSQTHLEALSKEAGVLESEFEKSPLWRSLERYVEQLLTPGAKQKRTAVQVQVTDFRVFSFIQDLKSSPPKLPTKDGVKTLFRLLRWLSKVCTAEGYPNPREAVISVPGWDHSQQRLNFSGVPSPDVKVICPSTFWQAILSTPLFIYQSLELEQKSDVKMIEETEEGTTGTGVMPGLSYSIRNRLAHAAELTLETEEMQKIFKHSAFNIGYSAIFIFLSHRKPEKLMDFLKQVGVLTSLGVKDIIAKLAFLKSVVEAAVVSEAEIAGGRVLSEAVKDKIALERELEDKRIYELNHPLTSNSRRLKAYISALYRHLGSILRNKGPMKSGLDADLVSIQTGFSKQRLAYCLGKFHDPGNLVWSRIDGDYRNDPDISFLFEVALKIPRTFSLKNICGKYLSLQQRYTEWDPTRDGSIDKRNSELHNIQNVFRDLCFIVQEALETSINPTIFWPDEFRDAKVLCRLPSHLIERKVRKTVMSNSNDVDTNAKLEVSASAVELVLIPRESSFYFSSIRDFAALKDQIEGAAYTEADIFVGAVEVYKFLGLLPHEDAMSSRIIILPSDEPTTTWDLDRIREALLVQLLMEDKLLISALSENGGLKALLSPSVDQVSCCSIVHQCRIAVPQPKRLGRLLMSTKSDPSEHPIITPEIQQSYSIWFSRPEIAHFDPSSSPPKLFWANPLQIGNDVTPILEKSETTIGEATLNFVELHQKQGGENIDPAVFVIPKIFLCLARFLGLSSGQQLTVFTREAIESLANSLNTKFGFTLKSLLSNLDSSIPPPSPLLDSKRWNLLIEALSHKRSSSLYFQNFSLHHLPEDDAGDHSIGRRLLVTEETNPELKTIKAHRQFVERVAGEEKKKTRKELLAVGRSLDEKARFKKMQFTELAGISTLSAEKLEVIKAYRESNVQSKRLKGGASSHARAGRYNFSQRSVPPTIYGFETHSLSKSSDCQLTVRFKAPPKCVQLHIKIVTLSFDGVLPAVDDVDPLTVLADQTLAKSSRQFTLDHGFEAKKSYGVFVGADFSREKTTSGDSEAFSLWAQTIFTARLPSPIWSKCEADEISETIKLQWSAVAGADRYLVAVAFVPLKQGFLFWDLNLTTRKTSCQVCMTESYRRGVAVFATKVIAITDQDVINPQSHTDDTHIDIDSPSLPHQNWIKKVNGHPVLKVPSKTNQSIESLKTQVEPSWDWWLSQNIEPDVVEDEKDWGRSQKRRVRPSKNLNKSKKGAKHEMEDNPNPWSGFRSDASPLMVVFPSGTRHVCRGGSLHSDDSLDRRIFLDNISAISDEDFDIFASLSSNYPQLPTIDKTADLKQAAHILGIVEKSGTHSLETQIRRLLCTPVLPKDLPESDDGKDDRIRTYLKGLDEGFVRLKNHSSGARIAYVRFCAREKRRSVGIDPWLNNFSKAEKKKSDSDDYLIGYFVSETMTWADDLSSVDLDSAEINITHHAPELLSQSNENLNDNSFKCHAFLTDLEVPSGYGFEHISLEPVPEELWDSRPYRHLEGSMTGLDWNSVESDESEKASGLWTIGSILGSGGGILKGIQEICCQSNSRPDTKCRLQFLLRETGVLRPINSANGSIDLCTSQDLLENTTVHLSDIREGLGGAVCPGTSRCLIIGTPELDCVVVQAMGKGSKISRNSTIPASVVKILAVANRRQLQTSHLYAKTLLPEYMITELFPSAHFLNCDVASVTWSGLDLHRLVALGYRISLQMSDLLAVHGGCLQRRRVLVLASRWDVPLIPIDLIKKLSSSTPPVTFLEIAGDLGPPQSNSLSDFKYSKCQLGRELNLPLSDSLRRAKCLTINDHVTPDDQTLPTIPIQWSSPVDPLLTIIPASHGRLFGGSDIGQRPPSVREFLRVLGYKDSFDFLIDTTLNEPINERFISLVNATPPPMIEASLSLIIHHSLPTPTVKLLRRDELASRWDLRLQLFDPRPISQPKANGEISLSVGTLLAVRDSKPIDKFWDFMKKKSSRKPRVGATDVDMWRNMQNHSALMLEKSGQADRKKMKFRLPGERVREVEVKIKVNDEIWGPSLGELESLEEEEERRSLWDIEHDDDVTMAKSVKSPKILKGKREQMKEPKKRAVRRSTTGSQRTLPFPQKMADKEESQED